MKIDWIAQMVKNNIPVYFVSGSVIGQICKIKKILNNHKIGIVHTHFLTANQFAVVKISTHKTDNDVVVHFHNHAVPSNSLIKTIVRKLMYSDCKMIGVSESVTKGLREIFPYARCYEVDNAIDFKRLEKVGKFEYFLNENDLKKKKCLIFGFEYERKGVDLALEAVSKIIENGEKIILIISLSTNEEIVKKKIKNRFGEIPSWVKCIKARNDVATLYKNVDVFLSPSREEGFCYSIVEAAYCGCNVVASRIPAQEDLRVPGVFWVESENIDDLQHSIIDALEKTEQACVKEEIKEIYNINSWAKKVIEVYESI
ncbi:MAG: glycosyltransferase family 4 protein [Lachnospiraceae bacterium]